MGIVEDRDGGVGDVGAGGGETGDGECGVGAGAGCGDVEDAGGRILMGFERGVRKGSNNRRCLEVQNALDHREARRERRGYRLEGRG